VLDVEATGVVDEYVDLTVHCGHHTVHIGHRGQVGDHRAYRIAQLARGGRQDLRTTPDDHHLVPVLDQYPGDRRADSCAASADHRQLPHSATLG